MARLTEEQRGLILADYYTGTFSQRELSKKHNVSLGTISKLTKDKNEQNEHLVNAKASVIRAEKELPSEQMNAIVNAAHDKVRQEGLVYGLTEKLLNKASSMSDQIDTPNDIKTLIEATHKAGQTLGVVAQFAPKIDITQQQMQTQPVNTTIQIVEDVRQSH